MVNLVFDKLHTISLTSKENYTATELREKAADHLDKVFGSKNFDFYLLHNGKLLQNDISEGDVHIIPRLLGGKGGFGSMLRAIGAQIEKTTNREACRDLSGRRLRDINEEKRLKKWLAEQAEREQEALKRKQQKLEKLKQELKHEFNDEDYTKARIEMPENIHESVEQGLQAAAAEEPATSKEPEKQKAKKPAKRKNTKKLWVDDLLDDSEASDLEDSDEETAKKKAKLS